MKQKLSENIRIIHAARFCPAQQGRQNVHRSEVFLQGFPIVLPEVFIHPILYPNEGTLRMMPVLKADMIGKVCTIRFVWLYPKGVKPTGSRLGFLNGAAGAF